MLTPNELEQIQPTDEDPVGSEPSETDLSELPVMQDTVRDETESAYPNVDDYMRQTEEAARLQAEMDARDKEFLAALDKVLEKSGVRSQPVRRQQEPQIERFAVGMVKKGVGVISLALILVMMGVVLVCCLFSSAPDFLLPLKLSPIAAVLLGLELLVGSITSGKRFRVHIPSIIILAVIVVGCCVMATVMNNSYNATKTEYNNRTVAAEIYDSSYKELKYVADISALEVKVDLNPDGSGVQKGMSSLGSDDFVTINATLAGSYANPAAFAKECKGIIDGYRFLGIPVTDFHFVNEGRLHRYSLDVQGKFIQDYSESRLTELVNHVYLEDYDYIEDLEDFIGESGESG